MPPRTSINSVKQIFFVKMKNQVGNLVKAGTGLYATGQYLYNLYKSSQNNSELAQLTKENLSRIPNKYLSRSAQMAKKSYSYSPNKKFFKKKELSRLRKKKYKYIKKKKTKRFSKYLNKVKSATNPYIILNSENYQNIVSPGTSTTSNSNVTSFDIGLCRFGLTPTNVGIWDSATDDISTAIVQATGGTISDQSTANRYAQDLHIDKMNAVVTVRNNSNIGVLMEAYWVSPRKSQTVNSTTQDQVIMDERMKTAMNLSYNPPVVDAFRGIGYSENLYDYPILCTRFKMKRIKKFIIYPAQTKMFKMASPVQGKTHNIANLSARTSDPKYHRALVFVTKGLPVHSNETADFTSGPVAYGPYKLDVIVSRKIKVRYVDEKENDNSKSTTTTRIPTILPQNAEIQPAVNPTNALAVS